MRPPDGPDPVHRVIVYYQTQYNADKYISPTPLISVATHLILTTFFHYNDKTIRLNDISLDDDSLIPMWRDIARMQGSGIKVMGGWGGAAQGSLSYLARDFDTYYKLLSSCITDHRLDGIDLGVENPNRLPDDTVQLILQLRADFGEDFIITVAPEASMLKGSVHTFSGFNYSGPERDYDCCKLERDHGDKIDWYNAQFHSGFGTMVNETDYTDIVTKCPLDPSRLVAVTLTDPNDDHGFVELKDVMSTIRKLLQMYGHRFGGVAGLEYYNSSPNKDEPWTWAAVMKVVMVNWREVLAGE